MAHAAIAAARIVARNDFILNLQDPLECGGLSFEYSKARKRPIGNELRVKIQFGEGVRERTDWLT